MLRRVKSGRSTQHPEMLGKGRRAHTVTIEPNEYRDVGLGSESRNLGSLSSSNINAWILGFHECQTIHAS